MKHISLEKEGYFNIENITDAKRILKGIGVKDECLAQITLLKNWQVEPIDKITLYYGLSTNLGTIWFNLKKINSDTVYSELAYWNVDTYKFDRNVNELVEFKIDDTEDNLKYTYIER